MSYKARAKSDGLEDSGNSLMCRATGCPLKWSVQTNDVTACSFHAWEDVKRWPIITDDILSGRAALKPRTESPTVRDMKTRLRGHIGNLGSQN
jgi:hypothetical protein